MDSNNIQNESPIAYTIVKTPTFERNEDSLKKTSKVLYNKLEQYIDLVKCSKPLPGSAHDHPLDGDHATRREFYIGSNMVVIYHIFEQELILMMINVGNHEAVYSPRRRYKLNPNTDLTTALSIIERQKEKERTSSTDDYAQNIDITFDDINDTYIDA